MNSLTIIQCGEITRRLRMVKGLKKAVFVVGGLVTEGQTLRDIDIVVLAIEDIPILKKALGKFAEIAHFSLQKKEPSAPIMIKITGKEPMSPDLKKKRFGKFEFAGPGYE